MFQSKKLKYFSIRKAHIHICINIKKMSNIIQNLKLQEISEGASKAYIMSITYNDTIYIKKVCEKDFESKLFDFEMLEEVILNANHKQNIDDVECDMQIDIDRKQMKMLIMLNRDRKPLKKINEKISLVFEEKNLDSDDKMALTLYNFKTKINHCTIKPVTGIVTVPIESTEVVFEFKDHRWMNIVTEGINVKFYCPVTYKHDTNIHVVSCSKDDLLAHSAAIQQNMNAVIFQIEDKDNYLYKFITECSDFRTNMNSYITILQQLLELYVINTDGRIKGPNLKKLMSLTGMRRPRFHGLNNLLKDKYVENIFIESGGSIVAFVDTTKKSNDRKISFHRSFENFSMERKQFSKYDVLSYYPNCGLLVEEIM